MAPMRLIFACCCAVAIAPAPGHAANYKHPYSNVDPRNDAGNDTGDAVTEQLNNAELQRPYGHVARAYPRYPYLARVVPPPRYYTPPPGYVVAPAYPAYSYGW